MKRAGAFITVLISSTLVLGVACTDDPAAESTSSGSTSSGGSSSGASSTSSSSGGSTSSSSGSTSSGGTDAGDDGSTDSGTDGGGCTNLVSTQSVATQANAGTYPTPAGGTIPDGTYVLSKFEVFPPDTFSDTLKSVLKFTGNEFETYSYIQSAGKTNVGSGTFTVAGDMITFNYACPIVGSFSKPYTLSGNDFLWFETNGSSKKQLWTYTKQ